MGYKGFDKRWKERRALERGVFWHRFDAPAKVTDFVEEQGRQADEKLPPLFEALERQRANVDVLRIVGGEPLEKAQDALWRTEEDIKYHEPWQWLRDCIAAKLIHVTTTTQYVHFGAAGHRNQRICRFGPHDGLEFGETGQRRQLATLARAARTSLRRGGQHQVCFHATLRNGREIVVNPQGRAITLLRLEKDRSVMAITDIPSVVIDRIQSGYLPEDWEEVRRLCRPEE